MLTLIGFGEEVVVVVGFVVVTVTDVVVGFVVVVVVGGFVVVVVAVVVVGKVVISVKSVVVCVVDGVVVRELELVLNGPSGTVVNQYPGDW